MTDTVSICETSLFHNFNIYTHIYIYICIVEIGDIGE